MSLRLSICIPTYNRGKFIVQTLNSMLGQMSDNVEIVVCDNASTDNTEELIRNLQSSCAQLNYFRNATNLGADRNYLRVVDHATGEYCWLFGSDDEMPAGSIIHILEELESGCDIYLAGVTLCDIEMRAQLEHHIFKSRDGQVFDVRNAGSREKFFANALTTTALFSFLGSIVVRKSRWDAIQVPDRFIGSLWAHTAKCMGMFEEGLRVKYLPRSLVMKRGDNDSFLDKGMVARVGVSVDGYRLLGEHYFGKTSREMKHISRVLRYEWPLFAFIELRRRLQGQADRTQEVRKLDRLFEECHGGRMDWKRVFARKVYYSDVLSRGYLAMRKTWHLLRGRFHAHH